MSLLETLCWLREELPLEDRAAPKRVLIEYYLLQEHARLQQSWAPEGTSGDVLGLERIPQAGMLSDRRVGRAHIEYTGQISSPSRSEVVEDMFRKARLKRCFTRIVHQQEGAGENHQQLPAPGARRQPKIGDVSGAEERKKEVEPEPPQFDPVVPDQGFFELGSSERPVPAVEPPIQREQAEAEAEAEAERRRLLLRHFFHAARRRDDVARDDRLDLGVGGAPAAAGGAPCFTVGGRDRSPIGSTRRSSRRRGVGGNDADGLPGFGLRRANLLRRVLQAMRESARERVLGTDTPPALPRPSHDHLSRRSSMPIPVGRHIEPPPVADGQSWSPQPLPQRGELPIHPRQVSRAEEANQAIFEALARLLPLQSGVGGGARTGGEIGRMQAAAVRCGQQCQGYIRALQRGVEVVRSGLSGDGARFRLVLQVERNSATGVNLALHDVDAQREAAAQAGPTGEEVVASSRQHTPASTTRLPLARVTRVKCLPGKANGGDSFRFAILATGGAFDGARGGDASSRLQGVAGPLEMEGLEEEPFGILQATSSEGFHALVLGVASVKSALDSPFRTRQATNTAIRRPRPGVDPAGPSSSGAFASTPPAPPTSSSPSSVAVAATACLPWQGARVCIVELAPSLTFVGAVRAVEAEARRVGREHGVSLRDQGLLICADPQY